MNEMEFLSESFSPIGYGVVLHLFLVSCATIIVARILAEFRIRHGKGVIVCTIGLSIGFCFDYLVWRGNVNYDFNEGFAQIAIPWDNLCRGSFGTEDLIIVALLWLAPPVIVSILFRCLFGQAPGTHIGKKQERLINLNE